MDDPIRFYATDEGEVADEEILTKTGFDTPEKIEAAFGSDFKLKEIWLKFPDGNAQLAINRKCQEWAAKPAAAGNGTPDDKQFIEPYVRIEVMVEKWNGFKSIPTVDFALSLHQNIFNMILNLMGYKMYPSLYNRPNFTTALRKLQESSVPENPA